MAPRVELPGEGAAIADFMNLPARTRTIVTSQNLRYTRHATGDSQLFDLSVDPNETRNITNDALREDMLEQLTDAMMAAACGDAPVA